MLSYCPLSRAFFFLSIDTSEAEKIETVIARYLGLFSFYEALFELYVRNDLVIARYLGLFSFYFVKAKVSEKKQSYCPLSRAFFFLSIASELLGLSY